jgi:hypothetical protein
MRNRIAPATASKKVFHSTACIQELDSIGAADGEGGKS